jgi:ketosteroid isomerase-like protein
MSQTERIQQTIDTMTNAFGKGDIDGVMRTYEDGAVVVAQPGVPLTGTPALRAMFGQFVALSPKFTFLDHEIVEAGDLALHLNAWRMSGVAPDGSVVEQGGLSVVVLRRQPSGAWLMVIDDPFGDWILKRASAR